MPSFHDSAESPAAPEEVWKLLYDPARFPRWWTGIEAVELGEDGAYTMYPEGYPDFPMAQLLHTDRDGQRVKVSCMVSELTFEWQLELREGESTRISVDVHIPESEAARLDSQRTAISASLRNLARLAGEG
jgi:uncharacterized protein YndB with AHSA1/START domain